MYDLLEGWEGELHDLKNESLFSKLSVSVRLVFTLVLISGKSWIAFIWISKCIEDELFNLKMACTVSKRVEITKNLDEKLIQTLIKDSC